jgi:hypothetical protein
VTKWIPPPQRDGHMPSYTNHEKDAFRMGLFYLWQQDIRPKLDVTQRTKLRPKGTRATT